MHHDAGQAPQMSRTAYSLTVDYSVAHVDANDFPLGHGTHRMAGTRFLYPFRVVIITLLPQCRMCSHTEPAVIPVPAPYIPDKTMIKLSVVTG